MIENLCVPVFTASQNLTMKFSVTLVGPTFNYKARLKFLKRLFLPIGLIEFHLSATPVFENFSALIFFKLDNPADDF